MDKYKMNLKTYQVFSGLITDFSCQCSHCLQFLGVQLKSHIIKLLFSPFFSHMLCLSVDFCAFEST